MKNLLFIILLSSVTALIGLGSAQAGKGYIDLGGGVMVAPGMNYADTTIIAQAFREIEIDGQLFEDVVFIIGRVERIVKKKNNGENKLVWKRNSTTGDGELNFLIDCDATIALGASLSRDCLGFVITSPLGTHNVEPFEVYTRLVNVPALRATLFDTTLQSIATLDGVEQISAGADIVAYGEVVDGVSSYPGWYDVNEDSILNSNAITGPNGRPIANNNQGFVPPGQTDVFWSFRGDQFGMSTGANLTEGPVVGGVGRVMFFVVDTRPKPAPPVLSR